LTCIKAALALQHRKVTGDYGGMRVKVNLRIRRNGRLLYSGTHDVVDADSFGKACAQAWWKLRQQQLDKQTSIGALMEHLDGDVLDQLSGALITVDRA
jgi:hypothetical protein